MRRQSTGSVGTGLASGLTIGLPWAWLTGAWLTGAWPTGAWLTGACGLLLMSAGVARADCAADFAAINQVKAEAGPYEVDTRMSITPPAYAGKTSPPAESNVLTQVVPPKSFRVRTRSAEVVIVSEGEASKGWVKSGDTWNEVPRGKLPDLMADSPTGSYFVTRGMGNLSCEGTRTVGDTSYLTFVYDSVTNPGTQNPQSLRVTAYFDPVTRRPAAGQVDGTVMEARIYSEMTYRFDASIKIEPPDH